MKDYSEMSDEDINKLVAGHISFADKLMVGTGQKDYCKNIDDAWKIIAENRINVEWHEMKNDTFKPYALSNETMIGYYDDGVLRAAMIVFLMMKDRESSHA